MKLSSYLFFGACILAMMGVISLVSARTLIVENRIPFSQGGMGGGNISSVSAGDGLQNTGTPSDVVLEVDSTVCRANGSNCASSGAGTGNMSLWRVDADAGIVAQILNNTLLSILGAGGTSTSLFGNTLTIDGYGSSDFNTDFSSKTTSDLSEGTNLYYTDTRVANAIQNSTIARTGVCAAGFVVQNTTNVSGGGVQCVLDKDTTYTNGTGLLLNDNQFNVTLAPFTTDNLNQGATNRYDNQSWNQSLASTLYYPLSSNPAGYLTTETDPLWTANLTSGQIRVNISGNSTGLVCNGCIGSTQIQDIYLLNTGDTGSGTYLWAGNHTFGGGAIPIVFLDVTNNRVGIGTNTFSATNPETLRVNSSDTINPVMVLANVNNYAQLKIKNLNNGTSASADFVVEANHGDESNRFLDLGVNNQQYTVAGWTINGAGDGYLYGQNMSLAIGTSSANQNLSLFAGGLSSSNEVVRVTSNGRVGIGTSTPSQLLTVGGNVNITQNVTVNGGTFMVDATSNNVGIFKAAPINSTKLQNTQFSVIGASNDDLFAGFGDKPGAPNGNCAMTFGYSGASFGQGSGFFNLRPCGNNQTVDWYWLANNAQVLTIDGITGNVLIGGSGTATQKLSVTGSVNITNEAYTRNNLIRSPSATGLLLADQSSTNDTVWTNISNMTLQLPLGSVSAHILCGIRVTTAATTTGMQLRVGTTGTTTESGTLEYWSSTTTLGTPLSDTATPVTFSPTAASGSTTTWSKIDMYATPSTGGLVWVEFKSEVAASSVTVEDGSWCEVSPVY